MSKGKETSDSVRDPNVDTDQTFEKPYADTYLEKKKFWFWNWTVEQYGR
jgi:hypothetical protein